MPANGVSFMLRIFFYTLFLGSATIYAQSPTDWPAPREVDRSRAAAAGIREITGKHLRLLTDVPANPAVDELPQVFDAAVPLWGEYFGIPEEKYENWQIQGFLIRDRAKFAALGLLSERNPDFINGYALGNELWLEEQPSDYYRRHLLLHEGTHSFMLSFLGAGGPGWYMEGMAELLGTHRWQDQQLELRLFPAAKEDVPMWGRIKIIRDAVASGKPLSLGEVMAISNREVLSVDAYAWCWALAKFLDSHPRYGERFHKLAANVNEPSFNHRLRKIFHMEWPRLEFEWEAFVAALDYGYDTQRMALVPVSTEPLDGPSSTTIAADLGWQSTPWQLKKGQKYKLTATGRYQIAHDGQIANDGEPWPCEPGGVTLRYHDGQPLGILLGTLRSKKNSGAFAKPLPLGLQAIVTPTEDAVLYLRVNDSPAELSENQGTLEVRITPISVGD